ncbi:MAG: hypothetical protein HFI42_11490 [Lachnospiraceae bacterium]|nr:hypothetical protein [Lachnospiraceae bacterium]MCI9151096.1 hypothetical protein [Lachnospiraceae bacterium]
MKKLSCLILLLALMLFSLGGCSKAPTTPANDTNAPGSQDPASPSDDDKSLPSDSPESEPGTDNPPTDTDAGEDNPPTDTDAAEKEADEKERTLAQIRHAYADILSGILYGSMLPDGMTLNVMDYGAMDSNLFAIADVDQDGQEELVFCFTNATMADMIAYVWGYNPQTGELAEKFYGFPSLTFYDNGLLMEEASHNHSLHNDFWPYMLHRYDESSNAYTMAYEVSGWQKEYYPQDYEGNAFPDDADTDGNGIVYLVTDPHSGASHTYDDGEFEAWRGEVFGSASPIELPWENLTYETVSAHAKPHLAHIRKDILKAASDKDLALLYMDGGLDAVEEYLSGSFQVAFSSEDESETYFIGTLNGQEVCSLEYLDATTLIYNNPIEGVTVLGIAPGMDAREAVSILNTLGYESETSLAQKALGFALEEGVASHYITGVGIDNYGIYLEIEKDKVVAVSFGLYCRYVG